MSFEEYKVNKMTKISINIDDLGIISGVYITTR